MKGNPMRNKLLATSSGMIHVVGLLSACTLLACMEEPPVPGESDSLDGTAPGGKEAMFDEDPSGPTTNGAFDGDVTNRLPSNYTVKIATFTPPNLPERCSVHGGATYNCRTYWLPSGRADDQINGRNWDTDGFMVEQDYIVERWAGTSQTRVPGFRWTRISSIENATCFLDGGSTPICEVE
jgi:hypothetical protein